MWFGIGKVDFPHFVDSFLTKQGIQMHKKCLNGKKEVLILLSQLESKDWKFLHFHEERRKRLGKVRPQKIAVCRHCRRRVLFCKIKVRPRSCRTYPVWSLLLSHQHVKLKQHFNLLNSD